jgi:acyl-CoA reductase-like NAD-dependent aldehyde dehydrogenase
VVYNENTLSHVASSGLSSGVLAQVKPIDRTIREVVMSKPKPYDVINPAIEKVAGRITLGSAADVDRAVAAARRVHADGS